MYRIFKSKGAGSNITVENLGSKANIIIGKFSLEVLSILKENGIEPPDYHAEWSLEVNKDVVTKLTALTLRMTKPIRDQRSKESKKDANKKIDAMDVMLGLAHYN